MIVAIILASILVPRMLNRPEEVETRPPSQGITGWKRLAIVASLLWPALIALYLKPWSTGYFPFVYLAFGPVALAWGIYWVLRGFRRKL